jgi:hypothetical protein
LKAVFCPPRVPTPAHRIQNRSVIFEGKIEVTGGVLFWGHHLSPDTNVPKSFFHRALQNPRQISHRKFWSTGEILEVRCVVRASKIFIHESDLLNLLSAVPAWRVWGWFEGGSGIVLTGFYVLVRIDV